MINRREERKRGTGSASGEDDLKVKFPDKRMTDIARKMWIKRRIKGCNGC